MGSFNRLSHPAIELEMGDTMKAPKAPATPSEHSISDQEVVSDKDDNITHGDSQFDHTDYPTGFKLATITSAVVLTVFCVAIDNTIITTAIPHISDAFKNISDVGWYASAYILTTCALQLFFGKCYTYFNLKWVFMISLTIFEIGSLICGVAPSSVAFIIGRAIAGIGSAGLFSGSFILIAYLVPLEKRPMYTGLIGGIYGVASVIGPLMGGAFTDKLSWRWCFYINLPFGALTAILILIFFHPAPKEKRTQSWRYIIGQFDLPGTFVFIPAVICLLLALQFGGTKWAWSNGRITALFVVFAFLAIVFVAIQFWKGDSATIPPKIASQRTMAFGSLFIFSFGASSYILVYYLPIWFQAIKNDSATKSGIDVLPLILAQTVSSIISGVGTTKTGHYMPFVVASSIFMSIGAGLLTTLKVDSSSGKWIGYQIIYGLGSGFGFQQVTIAVQTVLESKYVPTAVALVVFVQLLGGSIFISVGQSVFSNHLVKNIVAAHIPGLDPQTIVKNGATQLKTIVAPQYVPAVLEAYNAAIVKTFQVALIMSCVSALGMVGMQWRSVKGKKMEATAA